MADRVILHVGTPKAGTTYLQTLLWANRTRLTEAGLLLPGERPFEHNQAAAAVRSGWRAPRAAGCLGSPPRPGGGSSGDGRSQQRVVRAGRARTVPREALTRFGDAEVNVVVTARDLVSVVPAGWQETLKLGRGGSLDDFISGLEPPGERWGYWTLDPAWVLHRWAGEMDPARVHVVTVPTRRDEPHLLWQRFASVAGIPDGVVDVSAGARVNESLSVESARLLEMLGPRLRTAVDADEHMWTGYRWLRRYLSHTLLVPRKGGRIGLSAEAVRDIARAQPRRLPRSWSSAVMTWSGISRSSTRCPTTGVSGNRRTSRMGKSWSMPPTWSPTCCGRCGPPPTAGVRSRTTPSSVSVPDPSSHAVASTPGASSCRRTPWRTGGPRAKVEPLSRRPQEDA